MSFIDFFLDRIDWRLERFAFIYWPFLRVLGKVSRAGRACRTKSRGNSIAVTMITYNRPHFFRRTVESFARMNPNMLENIHFVLLVQGTADVETEKVIEDNRHVFTRIVRPGANLGTAKGYTFLMEHALNSGSDYILHLEDDWESIEPLEIHLNDLVEILEQHREIGYIRLRAIKEPTSRINLVTRMPLIYRPLNKAVWACNGHFTYNPTITRASVIRHIIPASSEVASEKKYELLGLSAAQLMANCFIHIGNERVEDWIR